MTEFMKEMLQILAKIYRLDVSSSGYDRLFVGFSDEYGMVKYKIGDKEEIIECDIVLSAVGVQTNVDNIGLEELGIIVENGKINVDDYYQTASPLKKLLEQND